MSKDNNVVKFPEPEYLLECNCGRTDFRLILGEERPLAVQKVECGCGEWVASIEEVLAAVEANNKGE